jgi:hypothetical protein
MIKDKLVVLEKTYFCRKFEKNSEIRQNSIIKIRLIF